MTNRDGARIYKHLRIRVVAPAGEQNQRICYTAPSKHGFGEAAIAEMLEQTAAELEAKNPRLEFRLVELAPDRFNLVYAGEKQGSAAA